MGYFTEAVRLPSAKFPTVGSHYSGIVVELSESDVPDFDDRGRVSGIKFGEDGTALRQVDVSLNTDDGLVVIHTDGAIFYAIGRALAEAGLEDVEVGDALTVAYTGDGEQATKGRNAPKQYSASISRTTPAKASKGA